MRGLVRHLFTLWSAGSLVLCVAVCVLWVRSYRTIDGVTFARRHTASSWLGGIHYYGSDQAEMAGFSADIVPLPRGARWDGFQYDAAGPAARRFGGFIVARGAPVRLGGSLGSVAPLPSYTAVRVPHWAALALAVPSPAAWLAAAARRRRRRRAGLCPGCGYDLRASPDRCPECGAAAGRRA